MLAPSISDNYEVTAHSLVIGKPGIEAFFRYQVVSLKISISSYISYIKLSTAQPLCNRLVLHRSVIYSDRCWLIQMKLYFPEKNDPEC